MKRRLWIALLVAAVVSWAAAAQALTVRGRVLDQSGRGLAGAIISDEVNAVASGKDGGFSLDTRPGRVVSIAAPAGYDAPRRWWWPARQAAARELKLTLRPRPSAASPLVALLADPHLFDRNSGPVNHPLAEEVARRPWATWERVAAELGELHPTLTIVAGDLCADADHGDLDHARAQMALAARALALLPAPARALPGNHDARYREGRPDLGLWRRTLGPARQVFLLPGGAFILLDNLGRCRSNRGRPRSCGNLPDSALAWLRRVLALIPETTGLYLVTHYPLLSPITGSNPLHKRSLVRSQRDRGLALRDADQAFRRLAGLLKGRRLMALINGHEHAGNRSTVYCRNPFEVMGLPALCGGWWQGDRPWDPFRFPPGYALLRLKNTPRGTRLELAFLKVPY